jgi:hypothetical protein
MRGWEDDISTSQNGAIPNVADVRAMPVPWRELQLGVTDRASTSLIVTPGYNRDRGPVAAAGCAPARADLKDTQILRSNKRRVTSSRVLQAQGVAAFVVGKSFAVTGERDDRAQRLFGVLL